jgi:ankyrin repeat protein
MVGNTDLKVVRDALRSLLLAAACMGATAGGAFAQDAGLEKQTLQGVGLVAAITGQMGETQVFGAGIVFAREKDRLYIATANHVVRQGARESSNLQIRLRNWPDKPLKARLMPQAERELDVAALTVDGLVANGIDPCALSLDRLAPPGAAKRGATVLPIGNPNGIPWGVPVRPDDILEVRDNHVLFESARIARGHSGGTLLGAGGQLIGMIQADEPPNGRALSMQRLIQILQNWNFPVHLRVPAKDFQGDYTTPLFAAVQKNDVEDARRLLGQVCTNLTETPESLNRSRVLTMAQGADMVNLLVQAGADVNPRTISAFSPLEAAAEGGHLEIARALIAHGADVNRISSTGYGNALAYAVTFGRLEMVKFLLTNGANPNLAGNPNRQTPVMAAMPINWNRPIPVHDEILGVLIQAGADVNGKDDKGDTPLTIAVKEHDETAIRILLEAGSDAAVKDGSGASPLHLATDWIAGNFYDGDHTLQRITMSLLQANSVIDAQDARGLLGRCAREGWADMASLVVRRGFKVRGEVGYEMLRDAARLGHPNVMRVLLEAGADPNAGGQAWTPLEHALTKNDGIEPATRFEMVRLLVSKGAKVNLRQSEPGYYYTEPIYRAVIDLKDLKLAEFLVAHGAVVTSQMIELSRGRHETDAVTMFLKARQAAPAAKK